MYGKRDAATYFFRYLEVYVHMYQYVPGVPLLFRLSACYLSLFYICIYSDSAVQ